MQHPGLHLQPLLHSHLHARPHFLQSLHEGLGSVFLGGAENRLQGNATAPANNDNIFLLFIFLSPLCYVINCSLTFPPSIISIGLSPGAISSLSATMPS